MGVYKYHPYVTETCSAGSPHDCDGCIHCVDNNLFPCCDCGEDGRCYYQTEEELKNDYIREFIKDYNNWRIRRWGL